MHWLKQYINTCNLHHAYLLEGGREDVEDLVDFLNIENIIEKNSPDLSVSSHDSLLVEDSWNLRRAQSENPSVGDKKVFVISAEIFTDEAQNALLKILEEPSGSSVFFLIARHPDRLFKTVLSRVIYLKKPDGSDSKNLAEGEKFLMMSIADRMDYVGKLVKKYKPASSADEAKDDDEETTSESDTEGLDAKSAKRRASHELKNATNLLLNGIEHALSQNLVVQLPNNTSQDLAQKEIIDFIPQLWKSRDYLFDQGSSAKMILEHIALTAPLTK